MNPTQSSSQSPGSRMRAAVHGRDIMPLIGTYDVFSVALAGRHFDSLFISGFGFAASHYGLPDSGVITWSEMVYYVQRNRTVLPQHHILVDTPSTLHRKRSRRPVIAGRSEKPQNGVWK